jgi:cytoskeletal protein RodZ
VGAFGEKLRQQREQRGLTLEAISNATKISPRMLRALEEEHFEQLPGGVFNKGFVRAYARQIGLNQEETVTAYLTALRESQIQAQQILPDFRKPGVRPIPIPAPVPHSHPPVETNADADPPDGHLDTDGRDGNGNRFLDDLTNRRKGDRRSFDRRNAHSRDADSSEAEPDQNLPAPAFAPIHTPTENFAHSGHGPSISISGRQKLGAAVVLICMGLGGWIIYHHHNSSTKPALASTASSSSLSQASTHTSVSAPQSNSPAPRKISNHSAPQPASTNSSATITASHGNSSSTPPATNSLANAAPKPTAAAPEVVRNTSSSAPTHSAPAKPPATFTLLIRAEETTWISITADGNPVLHETLIAPAHTSIRASSQIVVKAGNAAGISFLFNGKEIPASGHEAEVKSYVFTSTGLTSNPQTITTPIPDR